MRVAFSYMVYIMDYTMCYMMYLYISVFVTFFHRLSKTFPKKGQK